MGTINLKAVDEEATAKALANAGILYYCYGLTQNEIAKRMQVSRSTVSNYLRIAREQGIVDIRINGNAFTLSSLSRKLREKYHLSDVYIAETSENLESEEKQTAVLAAMALRDLLVAQDKIGVAWGDLVSLVSHELPGSHIDDLFVSDMIGGSANPAIKEESCAARIAARLGGSYQPFRAPFFLSSDKVCDELRCEPSVQHGLAVMRDFDHYLFSVESLDVSNTNSWSWLLDEKIAQAYKNKGAVGFFCGHFLNKKGEIVDGPLSNRTIKIDLAHLKASKKGILVSAGIDRMKTVRAALLGGFVDYLVIDQTTAFFLEK